MKLNFINAKKLLIFLIFLAALFVRLYNFENRMNFGLEQGLTLITSASYLEKPSLLGIESVRRITSTGHAIFFSPLPTYGYVPSLLISNYDPVIATGFSVFLNMFAGVLLFFVTKKIFTERIAIWAAILFLFNSVMISHSLFVWILHYIPLLNVLVIYFLWRVKKRDSMIEVFIIGLLSGMSFGAEYMYLLFGVPFVVITLIYLSKNKLRDTVFFSLGFIFACLPTIIFDLKHDLYHVRSLWQYFIDTLNNPGQSSFEYMHFLQFWPVMAVFGALILDVIYKKRKFFVGGAIALYLLINTSGNNFSLTRAIGMPDDLHYPMINNAAELIAKDSPENFNVATTYDVDSRAYPFRYLLKYRFNKIPLGITDYPNAQTLYVYAKNDYDFKSAPWEIISFNPTTFTVLNSESGYTLYKLTR